MVTRRARGGSAFGGAERLLTTEPVLHSV